MDSGNTVQERLIELRRSFREGLPTRMTDIESCWEELQSSDWVMGPREQMLRRVHSLAGASGTFGYSELYEQARVIECQLEQLINLDQVPETQDCDRLSVIIGQLSLAVSNASGDLPMTKS